MDIFKVVLSFWSNIVRLNKCVQMRIVLNKCVQMRIVILI